MVNWQVKTFKQLSLDELYDALKLRIDVFVVEQTFYYPDLDDNRKWLRFYISESTHRPYRYHIAAESKVKNNHSVPSLF